MNSTLLFTSVTLAFIRFANLNYILFHEYKCYSRSNINLPLITHGTKDFPLIEILNIYKLNTHIQKTFGGKLASALP